jgi:ribosomal protein L11 methyltransferase
VERRVLTMRAAAAAVPRAEALLTLAGAEAISLLDAADDPVLEPTPGTAPLWPDVELRALFASDVDFDALGELLRATCAAERIAVATLERAAWQRGMLQAFAPCPIGARVWLAPAEADLAAPRGRVRVRLHMGLAFGTGEHPTTALCLEWLDTSRLEGATLIDYGCGSGVLALTALSLGARYAWAIDNDEQALAATRANAALNGRDEQLFIGPPSELPAVAADVLVANILAGTLVELAPTLSARVRAGGRIVLSGILAAQAARVEAAYAPLFTGWETIDRDGWVRLAATRIAVKESRNR